MEGLDRKELGLLRLLLRVLQATKPLSWYVMPSLEEVFITHQNHWPRLGD